MKKNDETKDINVWKPKNPKKPYLIWKKDSKPLNSYEIPIIKTAKEKFDYLQNWRKKNCDEVNKDEFNHRLKQIEKIKGLKYLNFGGLVLPWGIRKNDNYNYAIFTEGAIFSGSNPKDENLDKGYNFIGTKFKGNFSFYTGCKFDADFPFADATICKGSLFYFSNNGGSAFLKSKNNIPLQEPFADLNIEESGGIDFKCCSFAKDFALRDLNLKNSYFYGANINKISFINCDFEEKKANILEANRIILADEKTNKELSSDFFGGFAVMYQMMKKSFEEQKDYQTAGKFYISEMFFRQKEATGIKKFILFLYGFCAGYGESIIRTGGLLLFCILTSLFFYYLSIDSWRAATNATFSSLLLFKNTDSIIFADILSRLLFIPAIFLFLNAIRRRLRRS